MSTDKPAVAKRSPGLSGLTRKDVSAAFEALSQRGSTDHSLGQLREHLPGQQRHHYPIASGDPGRATAGDPHTRGRLTGGHDAPVLAGVMEKLGEEAAAAADAHIEAMRIEFEATTRKMVQARDKAEQDLRDRRLAHQVREGQISDAKETVRSLQLMLSEERGRWGLTRAVLETQRT